MPLNDEGHNLYLDNLTRLAEVAQSLITYEAGLYDKYPASMGDPQYRELIGTLNEMFEQLLQHTNRIVDLLQAMNLIGPEMSTIDGWFFDMVQITNPAFECLNATRSKMAELDKRYVELGGVSPA